MKLLRLLALVVGLAAACGTATHQPAATGLPATSSTTTTTLPELPAAGLAVESGAGVDLLGLDGAVVASLAGYHLDRDASGIRLLSPTNEATHLRTAPSSIERTDAPVGVAPDGRVHGHWAGQFRSPDGSALLGAWSGECESPSVWLADGDGPWRPIVAGEGGAFPPESVTVGWAPDGRAVVYFTEGICGTGIGRPGTYLVTTTGTTTFVTEHPVDALWRT